LDCKANTCPGSARENAHLFHDLKDPEELFEQLTH
jgi:hypothetical protein